jgi:hypothetical protein
MVNLKHDLEMVIEFLNVKSWNADLLRQYAKTYGRPETVYGEQHGHDAFIKSRAFPGKHFFFVEDQQAKELLREEDRGLFVLPGETAYQSFLDYLSGELRQEWQERIINTRDAGPDRDYLHEIKNRLELDFLKDFHVIAKPAKNRIENWIECEYFNGTSLGFGADLKRLRTCKNPDCGKWFFYNRPKQTFCCDACRHRYNNHVKIKSGYLAEHQRKGRAEKPTIYNY